jgi:hypothetical protein
MCDRFHAGMSSGQVAIHAFLRARTRRDRGEEQARALHREKSREFSPLRPGFGWRGPCRREGVSQKTVQLVIGRLVTDEEFRLRFIAQPVETLAALREQGFDLTPDEADALVQSDRKMWPSTAKRIHPRLQRCSLRST